MHWPISRDCFTGDNSSSCHSDSLRSKSRDFSWNRECFFSGCWAGLRYSVPILVLVYPFGLPSQHCPGTLSKPSGVKPDGPDYGGFHTIFLEHQWPDYVSLLPITLLILVLAIVALLSSAATPVRLSMNCSIVVENVGKTYRVGQGRKERFKEWFIPLL